MTATALSRRATLTGLASLPMLQAAPALAADIARMMVGVGMYTEGSALVTAMQRNALLEKAAAELHTSLAVDYLDFQHLLRMLQGMVANQLQFGMLGSTPMIRILATAKPAVPIALAGGGLNFPMLVNPDGPIRSFQDLPGRNALTLVGGDLHLVLLLMLQAEFGTYDLKKLRITLRNATTITEMARRQPATDFMLGSEPFSAAAERTGDLVALARNNGTTGAAWDGPEGKGAGHIISSFKSTQFAPEAYYPHRIWWGVRGDFLAEHPEAVTAFLVANARAAEMMSAMPMAQMVAASNAKWAGEMPDQMRFAENILWRRRGWAWATEADVRSLVGLSTVKTIFETEIRPEAVKQLVVQAAPAARRAWEITGRKPAMSAFSDPAAADRRGLPLWEAENWQL